MIEPEIIVEFGTQNGFSTRLMHEAEPKTQIIYTYDPTIKFSKWMDEERIIFKKKGLM
jgi:predicted O-methyltransferase YrrM